MLGRRGGEYQSWKAIKISEGGPGYDGVKKIKRQPEPDPRRLTDDKYVLEFHQPAPGGDEKDFIKAFLPNQGTYIL